MRHPRSQIRATVRDALRAAPGLDGVTVYTSWRHALDVGGLPGVGVFTPRERSKAGTGNSTDRTTDIVVIYRATGGDDLEDHLDDISAIIEPIVLGELSGFALYELSLTEIDINGEGEALTGNLTLTFSAERYTAEGAP